MGRKRKVTTKQCAMTGMNFPVTEFYVNNSTTDGLHPYSKKADNFRRRTGLNASDLRNMFNTLFETTV
jgi:hypothetical protein|tara:strand:+ start:1126 stop:1329 length:204 start_codon:yes stop_codon:yes gene_type:complete